MIIRSTEEIPWMLEQCATIGITTGRIRRSMQWDIMDAKERGSPKEKEREVHMEGEDHSVSSVEGQATARRIARRKGRAKEKKERGKGDFKECATTAESSATRRRSAPSKGAKDNARARGRPSAEEESGK